MKRSYLKTGKTIITRTIDSGTGELLDEDIKEHKYLAETTDDFFLGYSSLLGIFMGMNQAEIRIFGYCLRYAKGVKFDISKRLRVSMSNEISLNERTILNTLPDLLDKRVLYKHSDGLYQVNPRHAFSGRTKERNKELKVIMELGCKDC